ncbi:enoyl-CoA hydratase/isomerase family protein [Palleronia pelagia]|uniref:3-hydroxyisobutyryl-CoA hydrolase n=1 Tax=Palleronia pelagia TaxID=387096 RepID=A0A1H8M991_9RHOB|nr:enoyl-CoA hydratase/isomerase family protein [Palleronia pelagia]SEO13931.1 enoyl-CoA hydratase [Palleronia pelagia]
MTDTLIRKTGRAGRITLNRPKALNALTHEQVLSVEDALDEWATDPEVRLVVIDAAGEKAFCAGGDITALYEAGRAGDLEGPRRFWREEYCLNAKMATYAKPIVTFMQGFTMGGGVGIGCHASHRVVGDSSRIAMPECGIGLVPDVGGSFLLARGPGFLGEYLGTTAHRMGPACAIRATFADHYIPEDQWPDIIAGLEEDGIVQLVADRARDPGESPLTPLQDRIDAHFGKDSMAEIASSLDSEDSDFARDALKALARVSPLSACVTIDLIRAVRAKLTIHHALEMEYRFTHRAVEKGDFLEGIRAAVIDKDRNPRWQHDGIADVAQSRIDEMLAPLGASEEETT